MSVTYTYADLDPAPCLPYVITQVYYGVVGQMDIGDMNWSEATRVLTVQWGHELTVDEKDLLDMVVVNSLGKVRIYKDRNKIMDEIFWTALAMGGQPRVWNLVLGLNKVPALIVALDNGNYPLARSLVDYALAQAWITQDDHDLALSKIPEHEYE
jgi:hypothetical protein